MQQSSQTTDNATSNKQVTTGISAMQQQMQRLSIHSTCVDQLRSPPKRLDGVDTREGVDSFLLRRIELQNKIMHGGNRILVTAPPGAGKSSLIQLLVQNPLLQGKKVLQLSTLGIVAEDCNTSIHGQRTIPLLTHDQITDWWNKVHAQHQLSPQQAMSHYDYILIDDAQRLYSASSFWTSIIKNTGTAVVLFFASTAMESVMVDTPAVPCKVCVC